MWYDESIIYQIYPLGYVGAPEQNDGVCVNRLEKIIEHIPHFKSLNVNAIYFCPIFESTTHGYDTKDYSKIDCRLGSNDDFKRLVEKLHENGIKVILDGVFNHVGREFFAFKDVRERKWDSPYKDWFYVNFGGNSAYNDGFYYEGWEGHYELVKLNLDNYDVRKYLFEQIQKWITDFNIDGLRLDVAYMLNKTFIKELRQFTNGVAPDFFLVGEMIHGDYKWIVNGEMLHSATNYECFKGIHSSLNEMNMFEISYSLHRQFGKDHWCLYTGQNMVSFIDNHDVSRISSTLKNKKHLPLAYGLLTAMPGIPCIYYGSEWGLEGEKTAGSDANLRPKVDEPQFNELTKYVAKLNKIRLENKVFAYGDFANVHIQNHQYVFKRSYNGETVFVMLNASDNAYSFHYDFGANEGIDLITEKPFSLSNPITLPPYSFFIVKI